MLKELAYYDGVWGAPEDVIMTESISLETVYMTRLPAAITWFICWMNIWIGSTPAQKL